MLPSLGIANELFALFNFICGAHDLPEGRFALLSQLQYSIPPDHQSARDRRGCAGNTEPLPVVRCLG